MSTLYIEEWGQVVKDINGLTADVPHVLLGRTQLSYTTSSVRTSFAFDAKTRYVILFADAESFILLGDSTVDADQNGIILPKRTFRSFGISQGYTHIAVIEKI